MAEKKGYVATSKFLIASPTKVRPVANVIKQKSYSEAMNPTLKLWLSWQTCHRKVQL